MRGAGTGAVHVVYGTDRGPEVLARAPIHR